MSSAGVVRPRPQPDTGKSSRRAWAGIGRAYPGPNSVWWLALVAAAFTAVELVFVVRPGAGLSYDEALYVSQVSTHAPAAFFDPPRSRGITLVVAPLTLLTSSVPALRLYLALASGLALFGALVVWRRLRPAWVLALAGLAFSGLWVVQYYGPRVMPDLWEALSALAAVGFFLRAGERLGSGQAAGRRTWWELGGLAACLGFAALVRVGDAAFLAGPLVLAVLLVRKWRRWQLAVAVVLGAGAGALEWVAEAYARFGGVASRLHDAAGEQGGFGLHLGVLAEWRGLNGPPQCRPCTLPLQHPVLGLWWLALPVLVLLGLAGARRAGRFSSSALASVCGLSLGVQYLFLIDYGDPRFLIPLYVLFAVPAADAAAWFLTGTRPGLRPLAGALVGICLVLQVVSQHGVLVKYADFVNHFPVDAVRLHRLGVNPPCLLHGHKPIPIAYYAGCSSVGNPEDAGPGVRVGLLVHRSEHVPPYARGWRRGRLSHRLFVYVSPRPSP